MRKLNVAHVTLVRFLPRVGPYMSFQMVVLSEFLTAHFALVRLLASVRPKMSSEVAFMTELLIADFTFEWLVPCTNP